MKDTFKNSFVAITAILLIIFLIFFYKNFSANKTQIKDDKLTINIDKISVLQRVQNLKRLETIKQVWQRDFELSLDSNDFKLFDKTILESNKSQKFAITGSVSAGVDLSQIVASNIQLDENKKEIQITLPAPQIMNISLLEDKIYLLNDKTSLLFSAQNIDSNLRKEREQTLRKELIRNGKTAVLNASCEEKILETANTNAIAAMKDLFFLVDENVKINIISTPPKSCEFQET
jgi:Protein of unknown function (DUF4230)